MNHLHHHHNTKLTRKMFCVTYVWVSTVVRVALPWIFSLKFYVYVCPLYFYNHYKTTYGKYTCVFKYSCIAFILTSTIKNGVCLCNGMFFCNQNQEINRTRTYDFCMHFSLMSILAPVKLYAITFSNNLLIDT